MLPYVKTICCDCAAVAYPSAGVVVRRLGRPLTVHTAALIPDALGCLVCGSKRVDAFDAVRGAIVKAASTPRCRFCDSPIPEPFRAQFVNADFCPLCVAAGRVSDAEVVAAHGTLFAGEAYREMAAPFLHDKAVRLNWLRKAVKEGHVDACLALGDMLSGSSEPSEVAEAASAFKKAADQKTPDSYAQHRLALMMLHGRGLQADTEAAIRLLYSAGEKGDPYALSDLARFILNGQFGLKPDPCRAFELFRRAHDMNPEGIMHSAAVALMLLEGIGVEPNLGKAKEELRLAISIYARNRPTFDAEACFEQVLTARKLAEGSTADLPSARVYLDWIAKLNVPGGPPSQTWRTFLRNHAATIAAIDLCVVPTLTFECLFAFLVLGHSRRQLLWFAVTRHPTAEWLAQQIVEAFPWGAAPTYLVRDNDRAYGQAFTNRVRAMGIRDRPISPRSPWHNPYAEQLIGTLRRDCLDHVLIFNERHLRGVLTLYSLYY